MTFTKSKTWNIWVLSSDYWVPQLVSIEDLYRAREFLKRWNLVSIEGEQLAGNFWKKSLEKFWERSRRLQRAHAFHWRWDTQVRALGYPAREFSKTRNLVSIEDTHRATGRKISKEIRRDNFEKSIVEKGSLLHTKDYIQTGTQVRASGYPI